MPGAIDGTLTIYMEPTPQPSLALPQGVQPIGDPYRVWADRDLPTSEPFVIVISVPAGTDTSNLALAIYDPGGAPHVPDPMWFRIPGITADEIGAYLVLLPSIPSDGLVILPVRDEDVGLPMDTTSGLQPTSSLGSSWLQKGRAIVTPKGAFGNNATTSFESAFDDILSLYRKSKLRPPLLQVVGARPIIRGRGTPIRMDYSNAAYGFYMVPSGTGQCRQGVQGFYNTKARIMVICAPSDGTMNALMKRTIIHEIFHAIQKRYGSSSRWWAESTAALAENSIQDPSFAPQLTPDYTARLDEMPLPDTWPVYYSTQDFWYHVLRERGLAFDVAMDSYMGFPMTVAGTNNALGGKLADEYWHWFKDQTYVKGPNTARSANPCRPDPNTTVSVAQLVGSLNTETYIDHSYVRYVLSGAVFNFTLPNTESLPVTWRLWFTIAGDPLKPSDRNAIDTQQQGCSLQAGPVEIRVAPGQTFTSGAMAANVDLAKARDDQKSYPEGSSPYRLHAKPLRGQVELQGPSGGLDVTVTEQTSLSSGTYTLNETTPGSGVYLLSLPIGRYDIQASGAGGYSAAYRDVEVQEDTTTTPVAETSGREIVFLGRSSEGPLNLYLWKLDLGTILPLTSFTDDTWATDLAITFAAARTVAGELVAVMLQDPGSFGDEPLYRLNPTNAQAELVTNLGASYQVSYVNLGFQENSGAPLLLRYFESEATRVLQMIDLQDGSILGVQDVSDFATQCGWRPGRSLWTGGYLLGCMDYDTANSTWTARIAAVPSLDGGSREILFADPAFDQFAGPVDFGNVDVGGPLIFVERALYPDFTSATGFIVGAGTGSGSFVPLAGEEPYECTPAPSLMQVACLRPGGVAVHTIDSNGTVARTENFALPAGYALAETSPAQIIDFVEALER